MLDPIDGTTNYAHGLPIFCASLALEIDGVAVVGAIYDPNRRELFTAENGPRRVAQRRAAARLERRAACSTRCWSPAFTTTSIAIRRSSSALFGEFISRARAVRRLGSAAIDLCYVAAGRFDGFWEHKLQPWDVAAGALIVEEAGGRVTTVDGAPFGSRVGQRARDQRPHPRRHARDNRWLYRAVPFTKQDGVTPRKTARRRVCRRVLAGFCRTLRWHRSCSAGIQRVVAVRTAAGEPWRWRQRRSS